MASERPDVMERAARESALAIVKRVLAAHDAAPIEDMERLIALAGEDPEFRVELLRGTAEVLEADPPGLVSCWLALIAGELGAPAVAPLLAALGTSEGEALDEAILPVLTRLAVAAYDDITIAIENSSPDDAGYRAGLYGVLAAVALSPGDARRASLRAFVLRRLEAPAPAEDGEGGREAAALAALAHMVAPEIVGVSARCPLEGRIAPLWRTLGENWRDTARDIEKRFGTPGP